VNEVTEAVAVGEGEHVAGVGVLGVMAVETRGRCEAVVEESRAAA